MRYCYNIIGVELDYFADIAKMIDHSLLRPELTDQDIEAVREIAKQWQCAADLLTYPG